MTDSALDDLLNRIQERRATVAVIGLGYVGLPLAIAYGRDGFQVIGVDVDPAKTHAINAGQSYIRHIDSQSISALTQSGRLEATTDFARLRDADAILICVPTPL
ncbi:MAG: 3-hydroxyacyl-CoA dehydrogenase NAD-binding domain-containing protein, partial [Planctomycetota bacterium]